MRLVVKKKSLKELIKKSHGSINRRTGGGGRTKNSLTQLKKVITEQHIKIVDKAQYSP